MSPRNSGLSRDNHLIFVLISVSKFNYWLKKVGFEFIRVIMVDSRDGINSTRNVLPTSEIKLSGLLNESKLYFGVGSGVMQYESYCMTKTCVLIWDTKTLKTQVENLKFMYHTGPRNNMQLMSVQVITEVSNELLQLVYSLIHYFLFIY